MCLTVASEGLAEEIDYAIAHRGAIHVGPFDLVVL